MEGQTGAWPSFDQGHMTSAPCDHAIYQQPHENTKRSQSTEEEWSQIIKDIEANNGNIDQDLTMLSPPVPTSMPMMHHSPRPSIEVATTFDAEPQLSAGSSGSSSFSFPEPDAQYEMWSATSAPNMAFPPAIPEHEPWSAPAMVDHHQQYHHGLPTSAPIYDQQAYIPPQAHHLNGGPSPMLSQGSPHDSDYMDDGWGQPDLQQAWLDGSGSDELMDADASDPCYAQLLYRCLKEAPDHTLSLRDLYDWVREHSQKAKDPKNRGWQNSVRHNLSMNAAFERVPPSQSHGTKRGSLWRLTQAALRDGVISTTRYRKDPKRKPERRGQPALKRQLSGAKGGQATRNATRRQQLLRGIRSDPNMRRHQQLRHQRPFDVGFMTPAPFYSNHSSPHHPFVSLPEGPPSPYFLEIAQPSMSMPATAPHTPPEMLAMYDAQPKPALSDFNFGHIDFANGGLIGNHDDFMPETPSLATEAGYLSEEGMHSLMSQQASREATSYPVEV